MTKRADLLALASRVEAGTAEQQADLIQDAWDMMGPLVRWTPEQARKFGIMIDAEAYESAALMLVPDGAVRRSGDSARGLMGTFFCDMILEDGRDFHALANTEAGAITAASLRALAEKEA
jgi:hypothetical protein